MKINEIINLLEKGDCVYQMHPDADTIDCIYIKHNNKEYMLNIEKV